MKRNRFIGGLLAAFAIPGKSFAEVGKLVLRQTAGFKAAAGEGRIRGHMQLKGINRNILDVKISGSDTDGDLAIFEQTSLSQGKGTPLHVHPNQDETFYVLEGAYKFKVGDNLFDMKSGDTIFLPRNVPHAWTQASEKGKMLVTFQPAGKLEEFFFTMANLDHEPKPDELKKIFEASDMKLVGPPLPL